MSLCWRQVQPRLCNRGALQDIKFISSELLVDLAVKKSHIYLV
jgi:hypothetical protein